MAHIPVRYSPEPREALDALEAAIEKSGLTISEAARAIGQMESELHQMLAHRADFPVLPEYVVVVATALAKAGKKVPLEPRGFPGFAAWEDANPSAAVIVKHLAADLVGDPARFWGHRRTKGGHRAQFYERLRAAGAKGERRYWDRVLAGTDPFPRQKATQQIIAGVLGIGLDQLLFPGESKNTPPEPLTLLRQLAELRARAEAPNAVGIPAALKRFFQTLPPPDHITAKLLETLRKGRSLQALATEVAGTPSLAPKTLEDLVCLALGEPGTQDTVSKLARALAAPEGMSISLRKSRGRARKPPEARTRWVKNPQMDEREHGPDVPVIERQTTPDGLGVRGTGWPVNIDAHIAAILVWSNRWMTKTEIAEKLQATLVGCKRSTAFHYIGQWQRRAGLLEEPSRPRPDGTLDAWIDKGATAEEREQRRKKAARMNVSYATHAATSRTIQDGIIRTAAAQWDLKNKVFARPDLKMPPYAIQEDAFLDKGHQN